MLVIGFFVWYPYSVRGLLPSLVYHVSSTLLEVHIDKLLTSWTMVWCLVPCCVSFLNNDHLFFSVLSSRLVSTFSVMMGSPIRQGVRPHTSSDSLAFRQLLSSRQSPGMFFGGLGIACYKLWHAGHRRGLYWACLYFFFVCQCQVIQ